ncbi:hypothetical protein AMTRI_Chr03g56030 [Amborella trichopoda]|uniref:Phytocyanin domain-containing protein n=1 Tax=Amborella trichopoda TaxID=13333 RepID=W1NEM3_AMBTC|nr:hypothetical protein AMTR_s00004p00121470 [Amborella trichopoda]
MAQKLPLLLAILFLPAIALATDYVVGEDKGWTIDFDYNAWAEGKDFMVGDTLIFNYPRGQHNVAKVNGSAFQSCTKEPNNGIMDSGNDKITLATPGNKWYICTFGQHCAVGGQKLKISVSDMSMSPGMQPTPNPTAQSSARTNMANGLAIFLGAIFASFLVILN